MEAFDYRKISTGCMVQATDADRVGILSGIKMTPLLRPDGKLVALPEVWWEGNTFAMLCNPMLVEPYRESVRESAPKIWIKYLTPLENPRAAIEESLSAE